MKQSLEQHAKALAGIQTSIRKEGSFVKMINDRFNKMKRDYLRYQAQFDAAVKKDLQQFERKE